MGKADFKRLRESQRSLAGPEGRVERSHDGPSVEASTAVLSGPASEPTLEQCERVAVALGFPILIAGLRPPYYAESLRNLHRLVQRTADGDAEAARTLEVLRASFGHRASGEAGALTNPPVEPPGRAGGEQP